MLTQKEIKQIRSLQIKKYRQHYGEYLIEGLRLVSTAVDSNPQIIKKVLITEEFMNDSTYSSFIRSLNENGLSIGVISLADLTSITNTVHPSGVVAICYYPQSSDITTISNSNFLYLDRIQDPGNLGTLFRTAAWFGINHIILSEKCVDPFNPKVVRAGMGAHFSLSIYHTIHLLNLKQSHILVGGNANGTPLSERPKIDKPWGLVIGNEAHGISDEAEQLLDYSISIPKIGDGESLNAAIAGTILLYELTTQNS